MMNPTRPVRPLCLVQSLAITGAITTVHRPMYALERLHRFCRAFAAAFQAPVPDARRERVYRVGPRETMTTNLGTPR